MQESSVCSCYHDNKKSKAKWIKNYMRVEQKRYEISAISHISNTVSELVAEQKWAFMELLMS